jgi:MFS family permease
MMAPPGGRMGRPGMGPMGAGGPKPSLRKALGVLKNRNYLYLFLASAGGFIGMNMQMVARGILAWELTQSYTQSGLVILSFALPMLMFSLIGGAVADRVNKRNLQLVQQSLTGLLALITAFLVLTDTITIELLFIVGLVQGTFFAFGMPARTPLMAQVVGPERLMAAIALSVASMNATRLIGPAVAGVLIAIQGIEAAYFAQAAMYLVTVPLILLVPSRFGESIDEYESDGRGGWIVRRRLGVVADIKAGLSYVAGDRTIRRLVVLGFIMTLFGMPYVMLLPGFADRDLGLRREAVGYFMAITGIGALFGSLLVAAFTEFDRKPLLQLLNALAAGIGLVLLGVLTISFGIPGVIVALIILGFAFSAFQTLNNTMVVGASQPAYQGRVMSIYMLTFSAMPAMAVPLGIAADRLDGGASLLFIFLGVMITVLFVLSAVLAPRYTFGRHQDTPTWGRGPPGRPPPRDEPTAGQAVAIEVPTAAPLAEETLVEAGATRMRRRAMREYMTVGEIAPRRDYLDGVGGPRSNGTNGNSAKGASGHGANGSNANGGGPRDYGVGEANGGWTAAREYGLDVSETEPATEPATNAAVAAASPLPSASPVTPSPQRSRRPRTVVPFEVWTAPAAAVVPASLPPSAADREASLEVEPERGQPGTEPLPTAGGRYAPPTELVTVPRPTEARSNGARSVLLVTSIVASAATALGALFLRD